MKNYNYIIVGAGAAGLMMAYRMSKDSFFDDKSILILDKEKKNSNDRTWCYWETEIDEWKEIVSKSWQNIVFKSKLHNSEESILPYTYKMIRSKDFYHKIWQSLENKQNFTFKAENVTNIQQEHNLAKVITEKTEYTSKIIINSILFSDEYKQQIKYPVLQQHFVGFFVKTKSEAFDDSAATFMDFTVAQKGNTRFMYVLPYSKNEALFEYTLFSRDLLPYDDYKIEIEKYLNDRNITDYEIVEKEQGSIPMTCYKFWKYNSINIIHIGTAGGWSKPSTGFTFKNTTKQTARLLQHLKQNKPLQAFYKIDKFWFYDLLLLDILSEKNHLGATIFSQMFKRTPTKNILKFLDEETSLFEDFKVIIKIPPGNFIRALFNRIFNLIIAFKK